MGKSNSKLVLMKDLGGPPKAEVDFDTFEVLRAIGKGAFGKVCLVEKKDSKKVFAMKYINKQACLQKRSVANVCAEVDMLKMLDHSFIIGLWYTFQVRKGLTCQNRMQGQTKIPSNGLGISISLGKLTQQLALW